MEQTAGLLDEHKVVQPYQVAAWLTPGGECRWLTDHAYRAELHRLPGVAFAVRELREQAPDFMCRPDLTHPGFAWAARRDLLEAHGLYDKFVLGGGDFVTMLAMYSGTQSLANPNVSSCFSPKQFADLSNWMTRFHLAVAADVAYTKGTVFHLWHGNLSDRRYIERYDILREFDFDPTLDIELNQHGCWQWSTEKPDLHRRVESYFSSRREDGDRTPVSIIAA